MKREFSWDTVLSLIPGLVLALVASSQVWRSLHEPLSSWRGGGFGMYADILDERGRKLSVSVFHTDWRPAKLDSDFKTRYANILLNPTHKKIVYLASYLSCDVNFKINNPSFTFLRIEYSELQFESAQYKAFMKNIDGVTVEICRKQ